MGETHVVVVSDSHLSARVPESERNWSAVLRHVEAAGPDVVVHVGDLSLDGTHDPEDLVYARAQLDRLSARWMAVPGNHDIGDIPAICHADDAIDPGRLERWVELIGPDRWDVEVAGCRFVGVNAQLFGSGLPQEDEQWEWLGDRRWASGSGRQVLVTHKPLAAAEVELEAAPRYRFVPAPERDRVLALVPDVVVLSGHVHQYRTIEVGGRTHIWAPTTWAVLPESAQRSIGAKRCGLVDLTLLEDEVLYEVREPPGIAQLTLGVDVPDPYVD